MPIIEEESKNIMTKKEKQTIEEIVSTLTECLPEDTEVLAEFPSRGQYYVSTDPNKPITIRPMQFSDEAAMASLSKNANSAGFIIQRCLQNLAASQLLAMDEIYLLLKIREISYGSDFSLYVACPACNDEVTIAVDISKLQINYLPEEFANPREIFLPTLKQTAKVHFRRLSDDEFFSDLDTAGKNAWRFVDSIGDYTNPEVIAGVLQKLPLRDIHMILKSINESDYGVDRSFEYKCDKPACGVTSIMEVPFTKDFFTVS